MEEILEELKNLKEDLIQEINLKKLVENGNLEIDTIKEDGTIVYNFNSISKIVINHKEGNNE